MPKDTVHPTARARTSYRQAPGSPDPLPGASAPNGTSLCQCQAFSGLLVPLSHGDGELPSIALGTRLQAPREPTDTKHPHTRSRGGQRAVDTNTCPEAAGSDGVPQSCWSTHLLRNMLLTSSCVMGGFLELAAIRSGRRKLLTRMWSCWTYSASASSMLKTTWFLLRMLSAWGDLM